MINRDKLISMIRMNMAQGVAWFALDRWLGVRSCAIIPPLKLDFGCIAWTGRRRPNSKYPKRQQRVSIQLASEWL